jgi:2-dehydro-3-deoxyphosphogluconate aldolase/(4S)-4-hydroxy-2-oxoglutarate aldolase
MFKGTNGHIAIKTNSVDRAIRYLTEIKGVEFDTDSATVKNGKTTSIYLKNEVAGFAVHLVNA